MPDLPVDVDATYADTDPTAAAHQQHHDALHALHNKWAGSTSPASLKPKIVESLGLDVGAEVASVDYVNAAIAAAIAAHDIAAAHGAVDGTSKIALMSSPGGTGYEVHVGLDDTAAFPTPDEDGALFFRPA